MREYSDFFMHFPTLFFADTDILQQKKGRLPSAQSNFSSKIARTAGAD
jgi:hypothetical protein